MDSLPEPVPLVLFRVMQEALNNVARHSGAARVEVLCWRKKMRTSTASKIAEKGLIQWPSPTDSV
jgi:signal transduction histidine kinase